MIIDRIIKLDFSGAATTEKWLRSSLVGFLPTWTVFHTLFSTQSYLILPGCCLL